ncbi:hypothetical protein [Nocardiopsis potens]|uniref:hypothetical protein n=1 Tax=Nocardiopsis potens TaxID=1246458 RepID=UPI00034DA71B|nr:hypothetical protein [Nocardiopsis potens]
MYKKIIAVLTIAAATLLISAPAAHAHYVRYSWDPGCGPIGMSQCGYSSVSKTHKTVYACDTYADGVGLWTKYVRSDGVSGIVKDGNGSKSGCGKYTAPSGKYIDRIRPCRNHGSYITCLEKWKYIE